jgi:hypothetical protein
MAGELKRYPKVNLSSSLLQTSLIAILLGRLGMTTTQAINAYNSLSTVLVTEPTEAKEDRDMNGRRFMDSFQSIIVEVGYHAGASMRVSTGASGTCKVSV